MSSRTSTRTPSPRAVRWTTGLIACGLGLVTAFGLVAGLMKLLAIDWTAFLVMMAGAEMGRRAETHVVGTVARRLRRLAWASVLLLLGPAAAVCIAAVPVGLIDPPTSDAFHAVVFGAATGLFLHVAIDFLPRCGWGSELSRAARVRPDSQSGPTARRVGNVRHHAVWSPLAGSMLVVGAWALL